MKPVSNDALAALIERAAMAHRVDRQEARRALLRALACDGWPTPQARTLADRLISEARTAGLAEGRAAIARMRRAKIGPIKSEMDRKLSR